MHLAYVKFPEHITVQKHHKNAFTKLTVFKTLQKYLGPFIWKVPNVRAGSNFSDKLVKILYDVDEKNEAQRGQLN